MKKHIVKYGSKTTPLISINRELGIVKIEGNCVPIDSSIFFAEFIDHFTEYLKDPTEKTIIFLNFNNIHSDTVKFLGYLTSSIYSEKVNYKFDVVIINNSIYTEDVVELFTMSNRKLNDIKIDVINSSDELLEIPDEIIINGKSAIETYLSTAEYEILLDEVKVIFVGNGGAGKTSLIKRIINNRYDDNEGPTEGISILDYMLKDDQKEIKCHLWDFGGQEIMHATHQFFLSKNCLYVLLLDGRKEDDEEYWLSLINSFGENSPIIIVINKIDQNSKYDVNRKFLINKYPNIHSFHRISCKENKGVQDLINEIPEAIESNKILKKWKSKWLGIKKHCESYKKAFFSYEEYLQICQQFNLIDKNEQDLLVNYLNDIGVIVHFDEFNLTDTYIIQPTWITGAVYCIINSRVAQEKFGLIANSDLEHIFSDKLHIYPKSKFSYIIQVMLKFELCYRVSENTILIPALLSIQEPPFDFDIDNSLHFRLLFSFLPKSVLPNIMVKMHRDLMSNCQWRTGLLIMDTYLNSKAIIKLDEREKKIEINVSGDHKREYLSIIRRQFRDVMRKYDEQFKELVQVAPNTNYFIEYEELVGLEQNKRKRIFIGKLGVELYVKEILDGIERSDERQKIHEANKIAILIKEQRKRKRNVPKIVWGLIVGAGIVLGIIWTIIQFLESDTYIKHFKTKEDNISDTILIDSLLKKVPDPSYNSNEK